jgi:hypothetical protein
VAEKGRKAVKKAAGCVIPIAIVGLLMFAGWWWWSKHGVTMTPGESREIHMEGMGAVALREVQWTPDDTAALGMRIAAPPGVEVTFLSASVKPSSLGEGGGTLIGIDYNIRIQVAPDAQPGDAEILLQFEHPKLRPPYLASPPVEKFRLKIRGNR